MKRYLCWNKGDHPTNGTMVRAKSHYGAAKSFAKSRGTVSSKVYVALIQELEVELGK